MGIERRCGFKRNYPVFRALVALGGACLPIGCSLAVDAGREQCVVDADCQVRGEAFTSSVCSDSLCRADPKWECVGTYIGPETQQAATVSIAFFNFINGEPVVNGNIRLCNGADSVCDSPADSQTTDEAGSTDLNIPEGFSGYILVAGIAELNPTMVFLNLPAADGAKLDPVPLAPVGTPAFLAMQLGTEAIEGRGAVMMEVEDCLGNGAVGSTVSFQGNTAEARPYYGFNGLPSPTAVVVDEAKQAGVLNALPGFLGIQVRNASGRPISQANVLVRAGFVSLLQMQPGFGPLEPF